MDSFLPSRNTRTKGQPLKLSVPRDGGTSGCGAWTWTGVGRGILLPFHRTPVPGTLTLSIGGVGRNARGCDLSVELFATVSGGAA